MDRISINYNELDESGKLAGVRQLPLSILIIGNFSGKTSRETHDDPFLVNRKTFNFYFKQCNVNLEFFVSNHLFLDDINSDLLININIDHLKCFHPYMVYERCLILNDYLKFIRKLEYCLGHRQISSKYFSKKEKRFFSKVKIPVDTPMIKAPDIVNALAMARDNFIKQVNEIIYNPAFCEVEFNWLNLHWLISNLGVVKNIQIKVMDTDRATIDNDLLSGLDISETELFLNVYTKEFDQYGGTPYSIILNTFSLNKDDLELAEQLSNLGRLSSCPIVSPMSVDFFGINDISLLSNNFDFEDLRYSEHFSEWYNFAQTRDSRFLGFFVNSCKMRDSYENLIFYKIRFVDSPPTSTLLKGLWGHAGYLLLIPLIKSYESFNTCLGIESENYNKISAELFNIKGRVLDWQPSKKIQSELERFGIISLNFTDFNGNIKLSDLNMLNRLGLGRRGEVVISIEQQMNVRLPQLIFISQLTHYMRMMQRQSISKLNMIELKNEIMQWLRRFISDSYGDNAYIRAQKPLKNANINLNEIDIKGGKITEFQLSITPHVKYRGLEYTLTI